jgi:glycosyltransferase involved in cell wall biosynthesis
MDVTIVIPCLNEEAYLGGLLENINRQTVLPKSIVVSDCHSKDKTLSVAKNFKSIIAIRTVTAPYVSASSARNAGARLAKTDYILFVDADTRLTNTFISDVSKKNVDILSPRFMSRSKHPFDIINVTLLNIWVCTAIFVTRKPKAIGAAILVKKAAHTAVGGFDEKVREFDDIKYAAKFNKGFTFGYAWKAKAIFSNRRFVQQGRMRTFIQQLPDQNLLVRAFIRPTMNKLGVKNKFED